MFVTASLCLLFATGVSANQTNPVIVAFGDSLFAGYGVQESEAVPARLQVALNVDGIAAKVIAAAVSGDTSADGLDRIDWMLADKPDLVIVELGANDMLRGLAPEQAKANLDAICGKLQTADVRFMLAGMLATPSLGPEYKSKFDAIYPDLAAKYHVPLYPFILQDAVFHPDLMQADGLHPDPAGVDVIVRKMLPAVETALKQH